MPPPLGLSTPTDFNPTCHLKITEDVQEEEEVDLANQEYRGGNETVDAWFVDRPDTLWLSVEPSS